MAAANKFQQLLEEGAGLGSLNVMLEFQLGDALPQEDKQVRIVNQSEADPRIAQQTITVSMKGVCLESAGHQLSGCTLAVELGMENAADASDQFSRSVARVGDRENLVGLGRSAVDELCDTA